MADLTLAEEPLVRIKQLGAWYYPRSCTEMELNEAVEAAKKLNLDFVVVSVKGNEIAKACKNAKGNLEKDPAWSSTKNIVERFTKEGMQVALMTLQSPKFIFEKSAEEALEIVKSVIEMCKCTKCTEIHFDIEPHTLPEWKKADSESEEAVTQRRKELIRQMIAVLKKIQEMVEVVNAPLDELDKIGEHPLARIVTSLAVPWWIERKFPEETKSIPCNCIYKMCYGGIGKSSKEIINLMSKDLPFFKPTVIGIGVDELTEGNKANLFETLKQGAACIDKEFIKDEEPAYLSPCIYSLNKIIEQMK